MTTRITANTLHPLVWEHLEARCASNQISPTTLIAGPKGIGKRQLAASMAYTLLHGTPPGTQADTEEAFFHPDLIRVSPEPKAHTISIEQIRALQASVAQTPHTSTVRVVIIEPADRLGPSSTNALLKTLEEPGPHHRFILVSDHPERLMSTLHSRCETITLPVPNPSDSLAWLQHQAPDVADERWSSCLFWAFGKPQLAWEIHQQDALEDYLTLAQLITAFWQDQHHAGAKADALFEACQKQAEQVIHVAERLLSDAMQPPGSHDISSQCPKLQGNHQAIASAWMILQDLKRRLMHTPGLDHTLQITSAFLKITHTLQHTTPHAAR